MWGETIKRARRGNLIEQRAPSTGSGHGSGSSYSTGVLAGRQPSIEPKFGYAWRDQPSRNDVRTPTLRRRLAGALILEHGQLRQPFEFGVFVAGVAVVLLRLGFVVPDGYIRAPLSISAFSRSGVCSPPTASQSETSPPFGGISGQSLFRLSRRTRLTIPTELADALAWAKPAISLSLRTTMLAPRSCSLCTRYHFGFCLLSGRWRHARYRLPEPSSTDYRRPSRPRLRRWRGPLDRFGDFVDAIDDARCLRHGSCPSSSLFRPAGSASISVRGRAIAHLAEADDTLAIAVDVGGHDLLSCRRSLSPVPSMPQ